MPRICKIYEITKSIYSKSKRALQFLRRKTYFAKMIHILHWRGKVKIMVIIKYLSTHFEQNIFWWKKSYMYRLMRKKTDSSKLKMFINEKFKEIFIYFTSILLNYVAHDMTKELKKNSHFENTTAVFLLGCQPTSVWNKLNLSLNYWFMEEKVVFCLCYGPKKWSKCHLDTIQTTFSETNNYFRGNIGEIIFLSSLKMHYFRGSLPKWVLTPQKETSCHIFKIAIFSKFFGEFMSPIIR